MTPTRRAYARVGLGALAIALAGIVVGAAPAGAHGLGGLTPTNYESRLLRLEPRTDGISLRVADLGTKLELTNDTRRDVVVLGYDGEPYLRVGPRGAFENTRSPATYINRSATLAGAAPRSADSSAPPRWKQLSSGQTAAWHDHRAHFMGTEQPPEVARRPDHRLVFDHWTVTMRQADRTITADGEIAWVPGPSPWPYVAAAAGLALGVFAASRTRFWRAVITATLAVLTAAELVHVVGLWGASTAAATTKLVQSTYSIGGVVLGIVALVWIARRGVASAVPLVLVAALVLVVAGGLSDLGTLGHSQIPSTLDPTVARLLVSADLGLGIGLAAAAGARLRVSGAGLGTRSRTRSRTARTGATVTN